MRDFINKHPKLYWVIVTVLAVVVFALITLKGCLKLERAEAAEEMSSKEAYNIACDYVRNKYGDDYLQSLEYRIIVFANNGRYSVLFHNKKMHLVNDSTYTEFPYLIHESSGAVFLRVDFDGTVLDRSGTGLLVRRYDEIIYNNYDIFYGIELAIPKQEILFSDDPVYSDSVPYVAYVSYGNANNLLIDAESKLETSSFELNYKYLNNENALEHPARLETTFYIRLPSKSYAQDFSVKVSFDFQENLKNAILQWQSNLNENNSVLFKLTRVRYLEAGHVLNGAPSYKFDYKDVFDMLETAYGDGDTDFSFYEYYNISGLDLPNSSYEKMALNILFGHMYINRVDSVLYIDAPEAEYYNGISTLTILVNNSSVASRVQGDVIDSPDLESLIEDKVTDALHGIVGDLKEEIDDLQGQLNSANSSFSGVNLDLEGNGLWESIKGVGTGLLGLTGFLGSIASVFGRVFVFLPYETQQIAGYFFMLTLFVALWKLIKR